jgi:transcriptional regulator with XRE-family HTH domain
LNADHSAKMLGQFLKSRRERLQPEAAGIIITTGRRRTPGLRREEVATLAHVSATYYTWLEQGRSVNPPPEVLEKIGEALQLNRDEQSHLLRLSRLDSAPDEASDTYNYKSLQSIIDQIQYPSFITNEKSTLLAWNPAAAFLISDLSSWPEKERKMMRVLFLDPNYRKHLTNWQDFAAYAVAVFRGTFDQHAEDAELQELVTSLSEESTDFRELWEKHDVQFKRVSFASFTYPGIGDLEFQIHSVNMVDGNPHLNWCIYAPVPGTGTEEKLKLLNKQPLK